MENISINETQIDTISIKWQSNRYELVPSLSPPIVSATTATYNSYSNATCLVSYWPPQQCKRATYSSQFCFVQDLLIGLALEWRNLFIFYFWTSRLQVLQGMYACQRCYANIPKIWLRRANTTSYSTPKVVPILKLSKLQGNYANYTCFPHESSKSTPFRRKNLCLFAHVFYESLPSRWWIFFFFHPFFFFTGNFGSLKTQISQKVQVNISGGKKIKKSVGGWQGFIEHVCQISGCPKSGVEWDAW